LHPRRCLVRCLSWASLATFFGLPTPAIGANLVRNGAFASDVAEWAVEEPDRATLEWSAEDAAGSVASGSALVRNFHSGPQQGTGISQCVGPIAPGAPYTFGGKLRLPTGQSRTGSAQIGLRWHTQPGCVGANVGSQPRREVSTPSDSFVEVVSTGNVAPPGAVSATFVAFPSKVEAGGELRVEFDDLRLDLESCAASATVLCLNGGRFRVAMTFATAGGQSGDAQAVALTTDTGYFWFFDAGNVETVTKVLNGCALNQRYWVFAGGLTDVQAVLTVADTQSGLVVTYSNPQGLAFQPIQDTGAFASCP
jgi:hypothetical protein